MQPGRSGRGPDLYELAAAEFEALGMLAAAQRCRERAAHYRKSDDGVWEMNVLVKFYDNSTQIMPRKRHIPTSRGVPICGRKLDGYAVVPALFQLEDHGCLVCKDCLERHGERVGT